MTAKEELLQFRQQDKLLQTLEREIEQYRRDMLALPGTDYSADYVSGSKSGDLSDKIAKLMDLKDKADYEWDKLINLRVALRKKIDRINEPILRAVLIEYYILKHPWERVCTDLGYSWAQTHRFHSKALQAYEAENMK